MDKDFMLNYFNKAVQPEWEKLLKTPRYQPAASKRDAIEGSECTYEKQDYWYLPELWQACRGARKGLVLREPGVPFRAVEGQCVLQASGQAAGRSRGGQAATGWSGPPEGLQECQGQDLQCHRAAGHRTRWAQQVFSGI